MFPFFTNVLKYPENACILTYFFQTIQKNVCFFTGIKKKNDKMHEKHVVLPNFPKKDGTQ